MCSTKMAKLLQRLALAPVHSLYTVSTTVLLSMELWDHLVVFCEALLCLGPLSLTVQYVCTLYSVASSIAVVFTVMLPVSGRFH